MLTFFSGLLLFVGLMCYLVAPPILFEKADTPEEAERNFNYAMNAFIIGTVLLIPSTIYLFGFW